MKILIYDIDDEIVLEANKRLSQQPIYDYSHRGLEANQVGILGEIIFEKWLSYLNIPFINEKKTTHDYRLININRTIEVKTKDRTVRPKSSYDCSVPLYNHEHQLADYYVFVSLLRDTTIPDNQIRRFKQGFILGACDKLTLEKNGVMWKKGQTDNSNGTTFWTDCINVKINQLISVSEISNTWNVSFKPTSSPDILVYRNPTKGFLLFDKKIQGGVDENNFMRLYNLQTKKSSIFLKKLFIPSSEIVNPENYHEIQNLIDLYIKLKSRQRKTHCFKCKKDINSVDFSQCSLCSWIKCECGACGCDYVGQ